MSPSKINFRFAVRLTCLLAFIAVTAWGSVAGSISGTVKDPSGNVVPNASVTVRELSTGVSQQTHTNANGYYTLPVLPVGHYELDVQASGFQSYRRKDIVLDTDAALTLDTSLAVGADQETVSVTDNTLHVEAVSTQLGEVIGGRQMTAVPLNGRSYTDLLSLQPGVAPSTTIGSNTVQDVGATILDPSGALNPGTISVNGQRETSNYFSVNGSDAEEDVNAGTAIIPNLDAISEFRIVTSNFDAEYGEFSGGQISVITKSGNNEFHGSAFNFLRNTDLDARNYFSPTRGAYRQNQFGGTLGGPIRHDKVFFFTDYQGTRQTQGIDTGEISVPSNADRTGDLSDFVDSNGNTLLTGTVGGPYFANLLTQKLGYTVYAGRAVLLQRLLSGRCAGRSMRVWECADSAERVVGSGAADAAIYSGPEQRPTDLRLPPSTRRCATTRPACGSMRIRAGVCCRPTTLSTTSISITHIRLRRAGPAFPASMR